MPQRIGQSARASGVRESALADNRALVPSWMRPHHRLPSGGYSVGCHADNAKRERLWFCLAVPQPSTFWKAPAPAVGGLSLGPQNAPHKHQVSHNRLPRSGDANVSSTFTPSRCLYDSRRYVFSKQEIRFTCSVWRRRHDYQNWPRTRPTA